MNTEPSEYHQFHPNEPTHGRPKNICLSGAELPLESHPVTHVVDGKKDGQKKREQNDNGSRTVDQPVDARPFADAQRIFCVFEVDGFHRIHIGPPCPSLSALRPLPRSPSIVE
ncbi:MAG: hypothetical protein U9N87_12550 [Planctomycetota bacterium]|nr:hypothetical protein [Planctomycetota bacterium]